jgi:uncharacterized protein (TIGR02466 family)
VSGQFIPELGERLLLPFATLLFREELEDMDNDALAHIALRLREQEPGVEKSNEGGWHSGGNIFARQEPELAMLATHIQNAVRYLCSVSAQIQNQEVALSASLFGWFNVNEQGDYNLPHHHAGHTWSGVYYVHTGTEVANRPMSGRLELLDPRVRCDVAPKQGFSHSSSMTIQPRNGLLLLFPSYLEHFVHPYHGSEPRITLAFNSLVQKMTVSA